ncbi:MAG TPA: tRNA (adenosine(37)-N6)-dimethylallyltransferase MiaA [Candidatus Scatovivens faecipullorum]|jgi:tRNA dimethylallyltransferase|nr:tRNA (adenosine(37)-N6)-dimethylallyltransferase MiaA [Candidatus Scatovivens faecipullorum]
MKPKVVVIVGPTASGKTALSIELAKRIGGEIISSDSMQIYKDMNIGTAKVTKEEMQGIKHYLIDFVPPNQRYTVSDFKKDATRAIKEILREAKIPIVVGGTGLYVNSLIYGIEYQDMQFDEEYRNKLMKIAETEEGLNNLWEQAQKIDPESMKKISKKDKKRIVRVLEIYKATGKTKTEQEILSRKKEIEYDFKIFGISMDREQLYERINKRVDIMINQGLEKEVRNLLEKYSEFPTAMQGLGYKEVVEYFNGILTRGEMIDKIKQESRRYAKRQLTWFRRNKEIIWLDANEEMEKNIKTILERLE